MERAVTDFLGKLGISDTEAQLYVDLLELGPSSIAELTRKSTIPRTTVRENVERLIQKGLVSQTFKGARKKLVAEEPNKAKLLLMDRKLDLENQQRNIEELEGKFEGFVNALYEYIPGAAENVEVAIKYYEGKKEVLGFYLETLKANKVYSFVNLDKFYEIYPDIQTSFDQAMEKNNNREVRDIVVDTPFARTHSGPDKYFRKYLPKFSHNVGFDIILFDNKVGIVQLEKDNTSATVIMSDVLGMAVMQLHNVLWELL